jgi:hypothetical protein
MRLSPREFRSVRIGRSDLLAARAMGLSRRWAPLPGMAKRPLPVR